MKQTQSNRKNKFKFMMDNTPSIFNVLSVKQHHQCFNLLKELVKLDISSDDAKLIIKNIENNFIFKSEYNRPIDWYFKQWSKTSFESDNFLSLLQDLEEDFYLISKNKIGYINLY